MLWHEGSLGLRGRALVRCKNRQLHADIKCAGRKIYFDSPFMVFAVNSKPTCASVMLLFYQTTKMLCENILPFLS